MLREFFLSDDRCTLAVAWVGVLLIVTYSVFLASVRYRVNSFYATFYDLLGSAVSDEGSGSFNTLADERREVWAQLKDLVLILLPLMWVTPASKWLKSAWSFRWRTALMKAYLREWNTDRESIEGASQRLHEDSQRFSSALQGCLSSLLDAAATLVVFTPALFELGAKVRPPVDLGSLGEAANGWLWATALLAALVGLGGAAFLGQRLVGIEVANQRVEASLRKDLVLLETNPSAIVGEAPPGSVPWPFFGLVLGRLSENYHALFRHFTLVNAWLAWHDQCLLVLPYFLAAPLLFSADPASRITLGTLIQVSNCFEKVFSSLSIVSDNWIFVNEFRSVVVRLGEFEARLYGTDRAEAQRQALLQPAGGACWPCLGATSADASDAADAMNGREIEMRV